MRMANHFVSAICHGERCLVCGRDASHKVSEEIPPDDPDPHRHNLTAYLCCEHFGLVLGPEARMRCKMEVTAVQDITREVLQQRKDAYQRLV
jgi:hypothetical protein